MRQWKSSWLAGLFLNACHNFIMIWSHVLDTSSGLASVEITVTAKQILGALSNLYEVVD